MNSVVKSYDEKEHQIALQEEGNFRPPSHLTFSSPQSIPNHYDSIEKDKNFDEDDNDIMSHLNYRKLEEIKKDFMKNEEQGLSIQ